MTTALTPELIASTWRPTEVRLSPDGARVAWTAAPYGREGKHPESAIWVATTGEASSARRWTRGGADTLPRWSPDGSRLAFCSDRAERGTAGLYVLDVAGGEARPVLVRRRSVATYAWAPDSRSLAVLAPDEPNDDALRREDERDDADVWGERWQRARLLRVDVDGGEPTVVWAPDLHLVEVAWSPDGSRLAVVAWPTPELDDTARAAVWVVDADGTAPHLVARLHSARDLGWLGPDRLGSVATHDGTTCSGWTVWTLPLSGGDPAVLAPARDEPRCGIAVRTLEDGTAAIVVTEGLDSRLERCDPDGRRETLWTSPGELGPVDVVVGAAGPAVAAVATAPDRPAEVWAGPPGDVVRVSDHHAPLAGVRLAAAEDFGFTGADGQPLDAVLMRPPDAPAGPGRTVVLVHGGPYDRSGREPHLHPMSWGQLLADAGFTVLLPNYRGGMGHGNDFAAAADGAMGTVEWADLLAATDAAVERGIADPDRLGIGGWSQGGFLSAWAVTQTDRFRAAVVGAGPSDWGMMVAASDVPTLEADFAGSRPWDGPGPHRAATGSPISYAAECRTPVLILHGAEDARVPVGQAVALHRALRAHDAAVELVTYPREPHGIAERRHQEDLMRRVVAWFERWL